MASVSVSELERTLGWTACAVALPGALAWCVGLWILIPSVPPKPRNKAEAVATAHTLSGLMVDYPAWWPCVVRVAPALWLAFFSALAGSIAAICASRCLQTAFVLPMLMLLTAFFLAPKEIFSDEVSTFAAVTRGFQGIFLLIIFFALVGYPAWRFVAGVWSLADRCSWSVLRGFEAQDKEARFIARRLTVEQQAANHRDRLGELD